MSHICDVSWEWESLSAEPQQPSGPEVFWVWEWTVITQPHTQKGDSQVQTYDKNKQNKNQTYPPNLFLFLSKIGFCLFLSFIIQTLPFGSYIIQAANNTGYCILMVPQYCPKK